MRPVAAEPLLLVCGPGHRLAGRRVTLADLSGESFVDFPPGWGNRAVVDRAFSAAGLDRQVPFEIPDFTAAAALVSTGLGIAFLPASAAGQLPDLANVEVTGTALRWGIAVATPVHRRISAAARAFVAQLMEMAPGNQDM